MAGDLLFSPKSDPKPVYSLLRSIAGPVSLSLSSFSFPNCSTPRKPTLFFVDYPRSHFSGSQLKALRTKSETICASSAEPRGLWGLIPLSVFSSPSQSFSRLPQNSPRPLALARAKLPIPC